MWWTKMQAKCCKANKTSTLDKTKSLAGKLAAVATNASNNDEHQKEREVHWTVVKTH